jgi:putative ABC transport system substrate-binding protein
MVHDHAKDRIAKETQHMTKSTQRHGYLRLWLEAVLLVVWALLSSDVPVEAQSVHHRVAVLNAGLPLDPALAGLREGLAQLGYYEEKNLAFMVENLQGEVASFTSRAAKIVEGKPDVIVTLGTAPTTAAKQATTTLPIVFAFVADPLRSGFVASYASSQNNLTGISNYAGPLSGKRLELLQEIAPAVKRVLVLVGSQDSVATVSFQFLVETAPKLGIELVRHDVSNKREIEQILAAIPQGAIDAIFYIPGNPVGVHIDLLIHKAKQDRIPLVVHDTALVERGALVSYGADRQLLGQQAAHLVAKILKGAKPSEMPIQTPVQLLLAINLSTAKAIGLDIPLSILERAERVVE